jgi:NAD(P)-dependent dehydrogenase (short-subunit alcohol dehydrogenase family)
MGKLLEGRVAVVTGAGRGIGRAEAIALAAEGAKVVVNDLGAAVDGSSSSKNPADEVVQEIKSAGGTAVSNYDTVATEEGAKSIIKTAVDKFGRIDILVNNAGFSRESSIFEMTADEWDAVIKTSLYGTFFCTKEACSIMIKQKYGRIVNTSSRAGFGLNKVANYSAAKEGVIGFTRTVALDMASYGITCNAIRPTAATRFSLGVLKNNKEKWELWVKHWGVKGAEQRLKRIEEIATPEGVTSLVVYLASEQSDNVNGCIFRVWKGNIAIYVDPPPVEQVLWKDGNWTAEELVKAMPQTLTRGRTREKPPAIPWSDVLA